MAASRELLAKVRAVLARANAPLSATDIATTIYRRKITVRRRKGWVTDGYGGARPEEWFVVAGALDMLTNTFLVLNDPKTGERLYVNRQLYDRLERAGLIGDEKPLPKVSLHQTWDGWLGLEDQDKTDYL